MLLVVLSTCVGCACIGWRLRAFRRLGRLRPRCRWGSERSLLPASPEQWRRWASDDSGAPELVALVSDLLLTESRRQGTARLNELVGELDHDLRQAQDLPSVGARVAMASGTLFALIGLARELPEAGGSPMVWTLPFVVGLGCAFAARQIDRLADARVRRIRAQWDAWLDALRGLVPGNEEPATSRSGEVSEVDPLAGSG